MNILITGSRGFIGKNLTHRLKEQNLHSLKFYNRGDSLRELEDKIKWSDSIIHLAGENRPKTDKEFVTSNVDLTRTICNFLIKNELKTKIIYSSSTKANEESQYGRSKRDAEEILVDLSKKNLNPVKIFRFPGIFGKWCKPNYNSVVATFCHKVSRNEEIVINNNNELTLCYIDNACKQIIKALDDKTNNIFLKVKNTHKIKLNALAKMIKNFSKDRQNLIIPRKVGSGLEKYLYSTFLSYIPKESFTYKIKQNLDQRGNFVEFLKSEIGGQVSFLTARPGITRGEHYHHTKVEKFLILQGKALFGFKNIAHDDEFEIKVDSKNPEVVETIPGWAHYIKNIGDDELIAIIWSNEIFSSEEPDTIYFPINE